MQKLKPCPFCGASGEKVVYVIQRSQMNQVHCDECCAKGSTGRDEECAIRFWNSRAAEIAESQPARGRNAGA
jgi:Lar family restriction alleviation protein